ncbi:MADS-box transcription factor 3-like [Ananas comosus]|uniref:MADS-box transcription factor 3-like n=2 Tax=Ananas comosus TaxID=4615 RepID=A0A6P5FE98_ANACO|nr:MADS-box transcription factor 3-like [Ananas comosus]CAD1836317.1 unnamed protein product [Ananas comosus var. bracteatus]
MDSNEVKSTKETSRRTRSLVKRRDGLTKKASELATLCEADVCIVSYSPFDNNRPVTWPSDDDSTVRKHIDRFFEAKRAGLVKQSVGPRDMSPEDRKIKKQNPRPSSWHRMLDRCSSRISLTRLASHLEEKLSTVNRKIGERGNHAVENRAPAVTNDRNGSDSIQERGVVDNRGGDSCGAGNAQDGFKRDRQTARICDGSNYVSVKELQVLKSGTADPSDCSRGGCSSRPTKKLKFARDEDDDDSRKADDDGPNTELKLGSSVIWNREKEEGSASVQLSRPAATGNGGLEPQKFKSPGLIRWGM